MKKKVDASFAQINSSHVVFFTIAAVAVSIYLGTGLTTSMQYSLPVLILFPLVVSLNEYLLNQLYSAGQIVFLYLFGYLFLPVLLTYTLDLRGVGFIAIIIWALAKLISFILEIIYLVIGESAFFRPLNQRLLAIDRKVDRAAKSFSLRNLSVTRFKGFIIALLLLGSYYAMAFALLHR